MGLLAILNLSAFGAVDLSQLPPPAARAVEFDRDVRPLFEQHCLRCHGPEKPKSHFRLDRRDDALRGGDAGVAIRPGNSAGSPLIHLVARLDPDLVMPPTGKGEPLSAEEVGRLRAWIDQGAAWGAETNESAFSFDFTPTIGFTAVEGNAAKFREHQWQRDGWRGGLESFEFTDRPTPDTRLTIHGHLLTDDYLAAGRLEKTDLGFVQLGFSQFRRFEADTGGWVPAFDPPAFQLGRELHLDTGRAWVDLGLTLPDWPRLTLGYEYQYRHGTQATLHWGPVGSLPPFEPDTDARNIFPAWRRVDERTHVLKFDAEFERAGWRLADSFRGEWTSWELARENLFQLVTSAPEVRPTDTAREGWRAFQGANTVRLEREFRDWFLASAGHLYSHLSADADFRLDVLDPTGAPLQYPLQRLAAASRQIVLERESHVANANVLLGPWRSHTFTLGAQGEWTRQHGSAAGFYDLLYVPEFSFLDSRSPLDFLSELDKATADAAVGWRFTGLPFTTAFAEARWQEECLGHRENVLADHTFDRDTDARSRAQDARVGFETSPRSWLKLGAHYRYLHKATSFADGFADGDPGDIVGYPTFLSALARTSHEVESRVTVRPARWLTATVAHRLVATDYETTTEPLSFFTPGDVSPGGRWRAGAYDAQVVSLNATWTPWRRWSGHATLTWQDARTVALHERSDAVRPYRGDTWSVLTQGRFVLNEKTDLTAGYTFSAADFQQDHFATGLPLGIKYDLHGLQAGFVTRCSKNLTLKLQYGFHHYTEPTAGRFNDYTAHAVMAAATWRLP